MKVLVIALLALALHLVLGWAWTLGAGVAAGLWKGPRGWLVGGVGVGLGWLALVAYAYGVAVGAVQAMTTTLGGLLGNLPGFAIVALTLLLGMVLGAVGGALGTQVHLLLRPDPLPS